MPLLRDLLHDFYQGLELFNGYDKPRITVFGSARTKKHDVRYKQVVELGSMLADAGYMVVTGGGDGMMEAAAVGATEKNSFALGINLPKEQGFNHIMDGSKRSLMCNYFFTRKLHLIRKVSGIVLTAGGFGTMDEAFETLALMQTGKTPRVPIILLDHKLHSTWLPFLHLIDHLVLTGMVDKKDKDLFFHTYDTKEAVKYIQAFKYH